MLSEYDYIIIQEIIEEFTENGMTDIEMSFSVEQNVLQQNIIDMIHDFIAQFDYITISVTGFQPSCELRNYTIIICFTLYVCTVHVCI